MPAFEATCEALQSDPHAGHGTADRRTAIVVSPRDRRPTSGIELFSASAFSGAKVTHLESSYRGGQSHANSRLIKAIPASDLSAGQAARFDRTSDDVEHGCHGADFDSADLAMS